MNTKLLGLNEMPGKILRTRKRLRRKRGNKDHHGHQHGGSQAPLSSLDPYLKKLALVGNPNTGKSVMFNNLTGSYATVSNYPGTTVEVTRGRGEFEGIPFEVVDTPGMYSLYSITEEERVARSILLNERPDVVLQLVDAKNLERMLLMTFQLIEAGLPLVVALNLLDEAEAAGIIIDLGGLSEKLGVPVVGTVATSGRGMDKLRKEIAAYVTSD
jgi:ferrous iron transport protein B